MSFPIEVNIHGTDIDYTAGTYPTVSSLESLTGYAKFTVNAYFINQKPTIDIEERLSINKKTVYTDYEIICEPIAYPTVQKDAEVFFGASVLKKDYLFLQYDGYLFKLFGATYVNDTGCVKVELGDSYEITNEDGKYQIKFTLRKR